MNSNKKQINMYFATHKTCNLSCEYCYIPKQNKSAKKRADADILSALTDFIAKIDAEDETIGSFSFHGSEPALMSPEALADAANLVRNHWRKRGFERSPAIQSNGVNFTGEYLSRLAGRLGSTKAIRLGFSIDPPKKLHDKYRDNSYDKVYGNFEAAIEAGFPVSVLSVVTRETIANLDEFGDWMKFWLANLRKNGAPYKIKVKLATGELEPSETDILKFADFLFDSKMSKLMQILTPGYCLQAGNECQWYEFDVEGGVYGCNKTYSPVGVFANWREESFETIRRKRAELYADYPVASECAGCPYEMICSSGCPVDRHKNGEMTGKAHECSLIKRIYERVAAAGEPIFEFFNSDGYT